MLHHFPKLALGLIMTCHHNAIPPKHWSLPGVSAQMTLEKAILLGVTLLFTGATILQCRKPRWGLGRLYAAIMNRSHGALTAWGLTHVAVEKGYTILDMGCGGGRTIRTLAA
ncbi:MAG TPA: hypothetical protein VNH83_03010, partial [Bryobacteraceae bacterium]|nr:hypothetical protein [Bryobacteraceae bacterium]